MSRAALAIAGALALSAGHTGSLRAQRERETIPAELQTPPGLDRVKPLLEHAEPSPSPARPRVEEAPVDALTRELFLDPPPRYRPWTRWWWLGNLVEETELRREVALFVEKGFGGVEIQAFSLGDRVDRRAGVRDRILQFDSDGFWRNVRATLDAARGAGLGVDLNHGSGWPAGGPWVGLADTYETLIYGETTIDGGDEDGGGAGGGGGTARNGAREVAIALPEPHLPLGYELTLLLERVFGSEVVSFPVEHRRLVAVVAAREVDGATGASSTAGRERAGYSDRGELVVHDGSETGRFEAVRDSATAGGERAVGGAAGGATPPRRQPVALDPATLRVLDANVRDGELRWQAPAGRWRVVAIYAMPAGEAPTLVAAKQSGLVLDHFHPAKVRAHYDYLFGTRTGIDAYWGDPLRGFFNDSLEFKVERHWTAEFLEEFERRRGYDLRPWLPALFVAGADNFFVSDVFGVHPEPDFAVGEVGERVRADYEQTVSDLVIENFYDSSREWAAARGLLSRAQGYGMAVDAIRAAGHIDIPETEALYAGGSDLFLKLASSGAHLYGRPLVSAESFVWRGAEYRTTPLKVRAAADKLFTAGVNHIVWHGTPYRVGGVARGAEAGAVDGFGEEGWYPWSIPGATLGFSTNFSEASPFWRDGEEINRYLARAQLLLRQGRPEADVLVYFPFVRFPSSFGADPEAAEREDLFNGWLREAEPVVPSSSLAALMGGRAESVEDPLVPWLREQQRLLFAIEEAGMTWEWANAEALEAARWRGGGIDAGDGRYGAILIASAPWLPPATAEAVAAMAEAGAPVFFAGAPPSRQPGFFQHEQGDARVRAAVGRIGAASARTSTPAAGAVDLGALRARVAPNALVERRSSSPAIRHLGRSLGDDRTSGAVVLVRNASAETARTELRLPRSRNAPAFYLDAVSGAIRAADRDREGWLSVELAPRDSVFVVAGVDLTTSSADAWPVKWLTPFDLTAQAAADSRAREIRVAPSTSTVSAPSTVSRDEAPSTVYTALVEMDSLEAGARYVLDLGRVFHAADVEVNGEPVARLLYSPFVADVTAALRAGPNTIEVTVRSPLLNRFIGYGERGDARYARFKGREPIAAGLLGPVVLRTVRP